MSLTDVLFFFSCFIFLCTGWSKGFLGTILGPVSLIAGTLISYIYYLYSKNLFVSLIIGILAPFFLKMALSFGLKLWNKNVSNRLPASALSRLLGSLFNVAWSGGLFLLFLFLIVLIPGKLFNIETAQEDIRKSFAFSLIGKKILNKAPAVQDIHESLAAFNNEKQMEKIKESEEFNALVEDQHIQDVLQDETMLKQIQEKDFAHLLTNPKMLALLNDPEIMKKLMAMHRKMLKEGYSPAASSQ